MEKKNFQPEAAANFLHGDCLDTLNRAQPPG